MNQKPPTLPGLDPEPVPCDEETGVQDANWDWLTRSPMGGGRTRYRGAGRLRLCVDLAGRLGMASTVPVRGRGAVHCPACGRYSRLTGDGLADCVRHGVQEVAFQ